MNLSEISGKMSRDLNEKRAKISISSNTYNPNFRLKGTISNFEISKMTKMQSSVGFDQDVV